MTAREEIERLEGVVASRIVGRIRWIPRLPPPPEAEELERLRSVVDEQQRQIADLTEKLRAVQAQRRRVPVQTLIESVLQAVQQAAETLEGHAIASAHAEIKAALEIDGDLHGLALGSPSAFPPEALSTISFDVTPAPPSLLETARREAVATLRSALLALQAALDRTAAGHDRPEALDATSALLGSPQPSAEELRALLRALEGVTADLPALRPEIVSFAAAVRGPDPVTAQRLTAAAEAIRRAATLLDAPGP